MSQEKFIYEDFILNVQGNPGFVNFLPILNSSTNNGLFWYNSANQTIVCNATARYRVNMQFDSEMINKGINCPLAPSSVRRGTVAAAEITRHDYSQFPSVSWKLRMPTKCCDQRPLNKRYVPITRDTSWTFATHKIIARTTWRLSFSFPFKILSADPDVYVRFSNVIVTFTKVN